MLILALNYTVLEFDKIHSQLFMPEYIVSVSIVLGIQNFAHTHEQRLSNKLCRTQIRAF